MTEVLLAFGLTLFAGMATGIGSIIAFTASRTNYRFLSIATGFSAGVMLYVSFVEIFFKGQDALVVRFGEQLGSWVNAGAFFGGMLFIGLVDALVPSDENPHEIHTEEETAPLHDPDAPLPDTPAGALLLNMRSKKNSPPAGDQHKRLLRMGIFTALAITIHNFPEGLVTFLSALENPSLGLAIAIAIALHNIPEGISVSVPIFYATGSRGKAFTYSMLSGLAEPFGAGVAFLLMRVLLGGTDGAIPPEVMGVLFAGVAGIMVYISLDELLPTSRAYGKGHDSLLGLIAGMVVMSVSLLMMK